MTSRYDPTHPHRRSIRLPGYDYRSAGAYFVTICTHQRALLFEDPVLRRVAEALWQRIPRHFPHVQVDAWVVMPNHVHGILVITGDARGGEASRPTGSGAEAVPVDVVPFAGEGVACGGEASRPTGALAEAVPVDVVPFAGEGVARRGEASLTTGARAEAVPAETPPFAGEKVAGDASPLPEQPAGPATGSLGAIVGNFKSVTARRINRLCRTPGAPVWQRNYYEHVVRDERALNAICYYIANNPARWLWDPYNPAAAGPDPQAAELWRLLQERGGGIGACG